MTATIVTSTSSTEPIAAVSHGPRSGERQNAGRNGPGGGVSGTRRLMGGGSASRRHGLSAARSTAAKRQVGAAAATAYASSIVSTSRSGGRSATLRPRASSRARCTAPVWLSLIGTPANTAGSGSRSPMPQ